MYEPAPGKPSRHSLTNRSEKPRRGIERHELDSLDLPGVGALGDRAEGAADGASLEGDVHDASRNVVAQVKRLPSLDVRAYYIPLNVAALLVDSHTDRARPAPPERRFRESEILKQGTGVYSERRQV
ncbi:hypothetical protein ABZV52_16580 [Streptomyces sp. NPDC004735]|uniref:hypothetical protein n=1 Tax=Streptomyces sp. NPDC004735 TaxID=3156654 RepID=UPI0033BA15B3